MYRVGQKNNRIEFNLISREKRQGRWSIENLSSMQPSCQLVNATEHYRDNEYRNILRVGKCEVPGTVREKQRLI